MKKKVRLISEVSLPIKKTDFGLDSGSTGMISDGELYISMKPRSQPVSLREDRKRNEIVPHVYIMGCVTRNKWGLMTIPWHFFFTEVGPQTWFSLTAFCHNPCFSYSSKNKLVGSSEHASSMKSISSSGRISFYLKSDTIQGREVDVYKVLVRDEEVWGWRAYQVRLQYQLITGKQQRKTNKTAENYSPRDLRQKPSEFHLFFLRP